METSAARIINTVNLRHAWGNEDSFNIPYPILADYYYLVPGHEHGSEGKPALRDLNGDGLALEAAFFEAEACMGLQTTMIGYSPKQDKVIQYQVEFRAKGAKTPKLVTWVAYLFAEQPIQPGHWSYTIDYTGRLGGLEKFDIHYDRSRERFVDGLK